MNQNLAVYSFDGIDIGKVELYSLRRQIGIVPQETVLFDGSIEENIALTRPEASTDEIMEAARVAGAHDFIMDLPGGYAHQVGERGSGLCEDNAANCSCSNSSSNAESIDYDDAATSALIIKLKELLVIISCMHYKDEPFYLLLTDLVRSQLPT